MSLCLLLQMNPYVSELALYDIQGTPGVACDISHINSKAKTKACSWTSGTGLPHEHRMRAAEP